MRLPRFLQYGSSTDQTRMAFIESAIASLLKGARILDAGAGELRMKPLCNELTYVSQDFAKYNGIGDGKGMQVGSWDQTALDIVCDITDIPEPDASFDAILCS